MKDFYDEPKHYRLGAVAHAHEVLDMHRELEELRHEVARLHDVERKYFELLNGSIDHSQHMLGGLLQLALKPGVMDAIGKANEAEAKA